jgi:hypothetical protein
MIRLASEFQGFARDLHDEACDTFSAWSPSNAQVQELVRNVLRFRRGLDLGNAHPGNIGEDFGRFGFGLWPSLNQYSRRATVYNKSLERLNKARNGIAHSQDDQLAELRAEGFPMDLTTFRLWRRHLDSLASILDDELGNQLGILFSRNKPW